MSYNPFYTNTHQSRILKQALGLSKSGHVGVFDLDSCLFDTRYRHQQIIREFAYTHQAWKLLNVKIEHIEYEIEDSLLNAGLEPAEIADLMPKMSKFWGARFFSDEYLRFDFPYSTGVSFVQSCFEKDLFVVYLTGRSHTQRKGTEEALRRFHFPYDQPNTLLITKSDPYQKDYLYKAQAIETIRDLGIPVLFLDNEPGNVNTFKTAVPDALVIHVNTVHSRSAPHLNDDIEQILSFCLED